MKKQRLAVLGMITTLAVGFIIAEIDTSKNWDDTAITATLVFLSGAILSLINQNKPWLRAILIALPIVLLNIFICGNYASIIALAIAFAGSYLGFFIRGLIRS